MKGGVRLETLVPRNGRTDAEYAAYLDGRQLPAPFQRYRFADITAKGLYGLMIVGIAKARSASDA